MQAERDTLDVKRDSDVNASSTGQQNRERYLSLKLKDQQLAEHLPNSDRTTISREVRKIERSPLWANRRVQRKAADQAGRRRNATRAFVLIPNESMHEGLSYLRAPPSLRGTGPKFTNSGRDAVIVVQHAAQTLTPLDHACVFKMARFWVDESVGQPLVIALGVIVSDEVLHGCPQ